MPRPRFFLDFFLTLNLRKLVGQEAETSQMPKNIAANKEIFDNAGSDYEQGYFDLATGGFILVHKGHNRGDSFDSEMFVAEAFARNGYKVTLLDESDAIQGRRPDAEIDGEVWDLKTITESSDKIDRRAQEGFTTARKQGATGVAFYLKKDKINLATFNAGIRQGIYWDVSKRIMSLATVLPDGVLTIVTREKWDNGQRF